MLKTLCELNDSTLWFISIGLSLFSVIAGFWLGFKSRIISNKLKAKEESIHSLLNQIHSEEQSIRLQKRPENISNIDAIHALKGAYNNAQYHVKIKQKKSMDLYWERYTSQIKENFKENDSIEDFGYKNFLTAVKRLDDLAKQIQNKWV